MFFLALVVDSLDTYLLYQLIKQFKIIHNTIKISFSETQLKPNWKTKSLNQPYQSLAYKSWTISAYH